MTDLFKSLQTFRAHLNDAHLEREEVIDGLKALRGLKAETMIPHIIPLLQHSTANVVRDAVRTLAELGNDDLVPFVEPLLNHPDSGVKGDAKNAIAKLMQKPSETQ